MDNHHISITLPCEGAWLGFAQEVIRGYGRKVGFSKALESMVTLSVMEALEALLQTARKAEKPSAPVTLDLTDKGQAVIVDIGYDAAIPLHPHETDNWEVPDTLEDMADQAMETLWLHLIKKRMDRVCFIIRGRRRILRLAKYRRDTGKEKQAWIMAVVPRLRDDLILHLDDPEAEFPRSVLQAPGKGVLRLGASETFLVRRMDGETAFHDLYMAHVDALGLVAPATLAGLFEQLEKLGMLASPSDAAGNAARFSGLLRRCINPIWSIPEADRIATRLHRAVRPLFSGTGTALLAAAGLSGIIPAVRHYPALAAQVAGLEQAFSANPWMILALYTLVLAHAACHELGHGTACKHFGGRVPRMGIMFYLATFIFYCDTTASINFTSLRKRLLVSLAGPLVSFAALGAGLWGAVFSLDTGFAPVMAAFCLFAAFGLTMNFNPFIKMDAYYMLSDITGVANLRHKSFEFLKSKLSWPAANSGVPETSRSEARLFWIYGSCGAVMTGLFIAFPLMRLLYFLNTESASGGRLIMLSLLVLVTCLRLGYQAFARIAAMRNKTYTLQ